MFFLTCAGTKAYPDPRMTSVDAALAFAKSSQLQVHCHVRKPADKPSRCMLVMDGLHGAWMLQPCGDSHMQGVVVEASGMADRLEEVRLAVLYDTWCSLAWTFFLWTALAQVTAIDFTCSDMHGALMFSAMTSAGSEGLPRQWPVDFQLGRNQ